VALDVETGALKLMLDDAGVPLHDATPGTKLSTSGVSLSSMARLLYQ